MGDGLGLCPPPLPKHLSIMETRVCVCVCARAGPLFPPLPNTRWLKNAKARKTHKAGVKHALQAVGDQNISSYYGKLGFQLLGGGGGGR